MTCLSFCGPLKFKPPTLVLTWSNARIRQLWQDKCEGLFSRGHFHRYSNNYPVSQEPWKFWLSIIDWVSLKIGPPPKKKQLVYHHVLCDNCTLTPHHAQFCPASAACHNLMPTSGGGAAWSRVISGLGPRNWSHKTRWEPVNVWMVMASTFLIFLGINYPELRLSYSNIVKEMPSGWLSTTVCNCSADMWE